MKNSTNQNKAIFLDRDGVIIEERNYIHKIEDVAIIPQSTKALKALQDNGFLLIVVTNQSGVGRGYFPIGDVHRVNDYIQDLFKKEGVCFKKFYISPEAPEQPSRGRKPSPAFLFDARDEFNIDLSKSYIVGDKLADLECGWNAGVKKAILVRTGYGKKTEQDNQDKLKSAIVVDDIFEAAEWILSNEG